MIIKFYYYIFNIFSFMFPPLIKLSWKTVYCYIFVEQLDHFFYIINRTIYINVMCCVGREEIQIEI